MKISSSLPVILMLVTGVLLGRFGIGWLIAAGVVACIIVVAAGLMARRG